MGPRGRRDWTNCRVDQLGDGRIVRMARGRGPSSVNGGMKSNGIVDMTRPGPPAVQLLCTSVPLDAA
jgi:hypothetical protein